MTDTTSRLLDLDEVAMTPAAIAVRARMTRTWAADHNPDWTVRQHLEGDIPALLAEVAQAHAVIDATRQMVNDANARLRAQLLDALGEEDDGLTALDGYVMQLVAQRDALKAALAKTVTEETR